MAIGRDWDDIYKNMDALTQKDRDEIDFQVKLYEVEQFVMAYRVNHEKIKAFLPKGYASLRPILRINVELINSNAVPIEQGFSRIEFNTPVEKAGKRGWLNLITWEDRQNSLFRDEHILTIPKVHADIKAVRDKKQTKIAAKFNNAEFLNITFIRVGKEGGCPKEEDNEGTFYLPENDENPLFKGVEFINENKEYCDCDFHWHSPAFEDFSAKGEIIMKAMAIPAELILGAYTVTFNIQRHWGRTDYGKISKNA